MAKCCGITGRIVVEANMGAIGAIMKYGSEAQKRLAAELVLVGRQAGHLHHRAGRGQRRERDDDPRRPARQRLRHQRPEALDHRRRRFAAPSRFRPRLRREGRGGRDRRLYRDPRRDARASRSASASRRWGCAAFPRPRSCSRTWSVTGRRAGPAAARAAQGLCRSDERL